MIRILNDLSRWSGKISRARFVTWALILFAFKFNLDRVLVSSLFHRPWSAFSYFEQPLPGIQDLSPAQSPKEFIVLLLVSLPFLWAGIVLCIKRLRSAQFPLCLVVLFVAPIVKWFLFVALALVPERNQNPNPPNADVSWLPKTVLGSAAFAVGASVLLAVAAMALSTSLLSDYGWGLFVGVPFSMGFFSALIHGAREQRRLRESITVAIVSVSIAGAVLLAFAFEGLICLLMAAPLAFVLAIVGAVAGHVIQVSRRPHVPPQLFCVPVLALPLMFASERSGQAPRLC